MLTWFRRCRQSPCGSPPGATEGHLGKVLKAALKSDKAPGCLYHFVKRPFAETKHGHAAWPVALKNV